MTGHCACVLNLDRTHAALAVTGAALLLAGCSGEEPTPVPTVTVTAAPTAGATAEPSPSTPQAPESDVKGRAHDVGTIVDVVEFEGTTFLELDRWTYEDWSDEKVAAEGVPLRPLTDSPFKNQNSASTYTVPVSPDVVVALNSCRADGDAEPTVATQPGSLGDLAPSDTVWLLTYTKGALTLADTVAPC